MSKAKSLTFGDDEFHAAYSLTGGFNNDFNTNHPLRGADVSFADFVDAGCDQLIKEFPDLVKSLMG